MTNLALTCAVTIVINLTSQPWTKRENIIISRAQYVCSTDKRYSDTPCLKSFTKIEPHNYKVICGPKQ